MGNHNFRNAMTRSAARTGGFTLIELLIVVVLIGVLAGIAAPSVREWRRNVEYRSAARDFASVLRDARSRAIQTNLQHQVRIVGGRTFGLRPGDRSNATVWGGLPDVLDWHAIALDMSINPAALDIVFNPNGSSDAAGGGVTINIRDNAAANRFDVIVFPTGRIQILRSPI